MKNNLHSSEVNAALSAATAKLKLGDAKAAIALLDPVLKLHPDHGPLHYLRGTAAATMGSLEEAETYLHRALQINPEFTQAAMMLANTLIGMGRREEAVHILESHRGPPNMQAELRYKIAELRFDLGDFSGAEAACRHLIKAHPDDGRGYVLQGRIALSEKRHKDAEGLLHQAARKFPSQATAHFYHARALSALGRLSEAEKALNIAAARRPGAVSILQEQARTAYRLNKPEEAVRLLQNAIKSAPNNASLHQDLSQILFMTGVGDHLATFREALARYPEDISLLTAYAGAARAGHQPETALPTLSAAIDSGVQHALIYEARAQLHSLLEHHESAIADIDHALKTPGVTPALELGSCAVLLEAGENERALKTSSALVEAEPRNQLAQAYRITALEALDRPEAVALTDIHTLTDQQKIECPEGFETLAAFNTALAARLLALHGASREPLHQSLRGGTQVELLPLLAEEPLVAALAEKLLLNVGRFAETLVPQEGHPFLGVIPQTFRFSGLWSVCLQSSGHHVSHVHPEGWLSSAYYVSLPSSAADEDTEEGALRIGCPPMSALRSKLPGTTIPPREGYLTLFPSYLWHGTEPFEADHPRLTVAFDIAP